MPKVKKAGNAKTQRHNPLAEEILEEEGSRNLRKTPRQKQPRREAPEEGEDTLPAGVSKKVLDMAQRQKAEDEDEAAGLVDEELDGMGDGGSSVGDAASVCELSDVEVDDEGFVIGHGGSEEEERAMAMFLPKKEAGQPAGRTLADVILEKIAEKEAAKERGEAPGKPADAGLSPKVLQVYTEIGKWMKHYKSGKMPKAFKVVPKLNNWEEVLSLTQPLNWSANAMYEAVKIFASNLNPRMAQRFYNLVLLPAVREDLAEHKRLNFHYFRALHKCLFKPAAFFKGIVLPLVSENCTLKEAQIISSVISKASVPLVHAAAVLVRLCQTSPWYGTTSIVITALVNKKYALPLRTIDALVRHFCAFQSDNRQLPVVWHTSLLVFVQRYKYEINPEQRRQLLDLLKVHLHDAIGPEVRRELCAPKPGEAPGERVDMEIS